MNNEEIYLSPLMDVMGLDGSDQIESSGGYSESSQACSGAETIFGE